ncbi:MAG: hypothetical protein IKQ58_07495 [Prevotella sp.]|nr:hypothetical protein [Prevotella sp.]
MKKITKSLMTLALLMVGLASASAGEKTSIYKIDYSETKAYSFNAMGCSTIGYNADKDALVITNDNDSGDPWGIQPHIANGYDIQEGYSYEIVFTMKASAASPDGGVRLRVGTWDFEINPFIEFTEGSEYEEFTTTFNGNQDATGCFVAWQGKKFVGEVDIKSIEIFEIAPDEPIAEPVWTSIIDNGDFESTGTKNFLVTQQATKTGSDRFTATIVDKIGCKDVEKNTTGTYGITLQSSGKETNVWDSQFFIFFNKKIKAGTKLNVKFDYKAYEATKVSTQIHGTPGSYIQGPALGDLNFTTQWQHFEKKVTLNNDDVQSFAFNMAEDKIWNIYYFDNFVVEVDETVLATLDDSDIDTFVTAGEQEILPDEPELEPFDTSKNHMLLFDNGTAGSNPWDHQANYTLPTALENGKTYVFEAVINAVNGGETRLVPNGDGAQYLPTKGLWTNEFTKYQVEFTANGNFTGLEIDLGACGGEVYFDNVSLVEKGGSTNLIENGDFETQGTKGWKTVNNTMEQVENELGEVKNPGILVSVGEAGWRTFRTGSNVKITNEDVKAYAVKYIAEGNYVQLTEVSEFGTWQSVIINAPKGDYMMDAPDNVTPVDDAINDLKANGGSDLPGDGTLYGLAKIDGVVGFYKISAESVIPAWAIYLQIPEAEGRDFIGFSGDATTVKAIETLKQSGAIYNLAGQQVKNAQKGIFIIDGKKVIK